MPNYKVRNPLTHGYVDDEGNNQSNDYEEGDEVELSEDEAAPLLEAGTLAKGDSTHLEEAEGRLKELEAKQEELKAELRDAKQEVKEAKQAMRQDPDKEYGTLVANEAAAPAKPKRRGRPRNSEANSEASSDESKGE